MQGAQPPGSTAVIVLLSPHAYHRKVEQSRKHRAEQGTLDTFVGIPYRILPNLKHSCVVFEDGTSAKLEI